MVAMYFLQHTNGYVLEFSPDYELNSKSGWKMPQHFAWIARNGVITRDVDIPPTRMDREESWVDKLSSSFAPPALLIPSDTKHLVKFAHGLSVVWDLICVGIGMWLVRRYRFATGAAAGWLIFIAIAGIPGLLTFICIQEWPARETCRNCGKLRAVDRELCEYCAADFPAPEKNGTEIFAPLVKG
jgi:hypothetical protein